MKKYFNNSVPITFMMLTDLPCEMQIQIINNVSYVNYSLVNNLFNTIYKNKLLTNTKNIQKWYRRYRLTENIPDPSNVTRKTLIRYYITKYTEEWLRKFPRFCISKLGITLVEDKFYDPYFCDGNLTSFFREFCNKYMKHKEDFYYAGW